jgi:hypothetical protein
VIFKTIITCVLTASLAIGYVHQRIEIVKSGYYLTENRKHLSGLVDRNSKLMYNLSKLESPGTLLAAFDTEDVKFANKRTKTEKRISVACLVLEENDVPNGLIGRVLDIFSTSAEAKSSK